MRIEVAKWGSKSKRTGGHFRVTHGHCWIAHVSESSLVGFAAAALSAAHVFQI
jgi:hypothetical protein